MFMHRATAALAWLLALCPLSPAQLEPQRAESAFRVAPGLEFKLWASEPMFANPTAIDVDPAGRVWVCEAVNYRQLLRGKPVLRPEGDRILILEDTRGEGRADRVTVFSQGPFLQAPLGIAVLKDPVGPRVRVYVAQSPDILLFEDRDGDGRADGPPTKFLSGFGGVDHDHGVHGLVFGPDGMLYFTVGDQGINGLEDRHGKRWSTNSTDCQAGTVWRVAPDGTGLEMLAHNFRNQYKLAIDSFGTMFVSDNDDDGHQQTRICHVMPGGNHGYWPRGRGETHWHEESPGVVPKVLRTYFGSPTGMCSYEGRNLPEKYFRNLIHCDAGPREVRAYRPRPAGAGYELDTEVLVSSTDNWFRPSDVSVGPAGDVFVADWYDPGVGGHGMGDTTRGRIYRLSGIGRSKSPQPSGHCNRLDDVLSALQSPNVATYRMGLAGLKELPRGDAEVVLAGLSGTSAESVIRARGIWAGSTLTSEKAGYSRSVLAKQFADSADDDLRRLAIRVATAAGVSPAELAGPDRARFLASGPLVLAEGLLALRSLPAEKAGPTFWELVDRWDGEDRFFLAAIGIAAGDDPKRRQTLLADFERRFPAWSQRSLRLAWELRPPGVTPALIRQLANAGLSPTVRIQIVDALSSSSDPGVGQAFLERLAVEEVAEVREAISRTLTTHLPGKWRSIGQASRFRETVDQLFNRRETASVALALLVAADDATAFPRIRELVDDRSATRDLRSAAVLALGTVRHAEAPATLERLMGDPDFRQDAATALARQIDRRQGQHDAALRILKKESIRDHRVALPALVQTRDGAQWALERAAGGHWSGEPAAEAARLLRMSPFPDLRNRALVAFPTTAKLDVAGLPPLSVLAARRGDATNGQRLLFASLSSELQCLKCHAVRGVGGAIGPDLSQIGTKASRENLYESILHPSKAIADQFVQWSVTTGQGRTVSGLLIDENDRSLTIRTATGEDHVVPKSDIEVREKSPTSLMPNDLVGSITERELADLVEYLSLTRSVLLGTLKWTEAGAPTRVNPVGMIQSAKAAEATLTVPADLDAMLVFTSPAAAALSVNGELLRTTRAEPDWSGWNVKVPVRLKKGANILRVSFESTAGGSFYCAVVTEAEAPSR